jgi:hypothetical protein
MKLERKAAASKARAALELALDCEFPAAALDAQNDWMGDA